MSNIRAKLLRYLACLVHGRDRYGLTSRRNRRALLLHEFYRTHGKRRF